MNIRVKHALVGLMFAAAFAGCVGSVSAIMRASASTPPARSLGDALNDCGGRSIRRVYMTEDAGDGTAHRVGRYECDNGKHVSL